MSDQSTSAPSAPRSRKMELLVWGALGLTIAAIGIAFLRSKIPGEKSLPVIGQIPDFILTNQDNAPVTLADLRGKVWVANIIFTRCPGPCPAMTHHLAELQAALPADLPVKLVTLTSDPDYDTPAMLKRWAIRFGADSNRWYFLTGPKPLIRSLAVNDFRFTVVEKPPGDRSVPDDLFIHSIFYVLVDQRGQVRGWTDEAGSLHAYFDSEDPATKDGLLRAINQLLREKK